MDRMKWASIAASALAVAGVPTLGHAADYVWNNTAGGDWATTGNWTPSGRPTGTAGVTDTAVIDAEAVTPYVVTKNSAYSGLLSSFIVDSTSATFQLGNLPTTQTRGIRMADGGVADLKTGTLLFVNGAGATNGAFFIDEDSGTDVASSLKIGSNFLVDVQSIGGTVPLTRTLDDAGRIDIAEQKGTIRIGVGTDVVSQGAQFVEVSYGFTNEGTIRLSNTLSSGSSSNSTFRILNDMTLVNKGTFRTETGGSNGTADGNVRALRFALTNDTTGLLSIESVGLQAARLGDNGAVHTNQGTFRISEGATLALWGGNTLSNLEDGLIEGKGTLDTSGSTFTNAGIFSPGGSDALGTLSIVGDFTSSDTARLLVELGSDGHDVLNLSGSVALDGWLDVSLLSGFTPDAGDSFTVVTGAYTGEFVNVAGGKLAFGGGEFDVTYNADSVVLSNFVPIPEPATFALLVLGGLAMGRRRQNP